MVDVNSEHKVSKHPLPSDQGYVLNEQVGHLIRKAQQRHTAIFQQYCSDLQLTPIQFAALCVIVEKDSSSLTELVQATDIDQATIRGVVSRLKKQELIKLASDPNDQRKVMVQATAKGKKVLSQMVPVAQKITEKTLEKLNAPERVALFHLLEKIS